MGSRADIMAGRSYVELYVKNSRFLRGLRNARNTLRRFSADMQAMGRQMVGISAGMGVPLALAVKTFASFDDQMRRVQAVTGATGEQFERMTVMAKKLGSTTAFTASQAADGMAFLGQAGFDTEQILAGIPDVLNLAAAGAIELGTAADIASNVAGGFGLAADEIGRVADTLAQTASSANTNIEEMGEAFAKAAPAARAAGQEIEEVSASIGIMGDSGVKASVAGTDTSNILLVMAQNAKIAGVATTDSAGNMRDMLDVMNDLGGATSNLSEAEKLSFFVETFGKRSAKSALILSNANERIDQMREKMANASGRAKEMAETMEGGIGGAFRRVKSAVEGVAISLGEVLSESLQDVAKMASKFLGDVSELVKNNKDAVITFGKWAIAIGAAGAALFGIGLAAQAVAFVFGGLAGAVSFVVGSLGFVSTILGAIVSPVGLVVAGVAGLSVALLNATGGFQVIGEAASGDDRFHERTVGQAKGNRRHDDRWYQRRDNWW